MTHPPSPKISSPRDTEPTLEFLDDEEPTAAVAAETWKVLVADDDPGVHEVTRWVLRDLVFAGRSLELISAYSGAEALRLLGEHPDTAVIFLDVVMESEHAGLDVAHSIRETLGNHLVRIILRTGQPGRAPESRVVLDYDINDYKEKTELTAQKLTTTLISALRSYLEVITLERSRQGLTEAVELSRNDLAKEQRWSEEQLREITDALGEAVFVRNVAGEITFVNPQVCKFLGFASHEMIGKNSHELFHHSRPDGSPFPKAECPIDCVAVPHAQKSCNDTFWRKDGTPIPVALVIAPLMRDGETIGSVVSFRDITDMLRFEKELMDARDIAHASERVKSEFISSMSHEIRTPMNGILGMTELLQATEMSTEQREYVDMIQFSGEYLLTIINEILDFSKIEANRIELDPVDFDLRRGVTEVLQTLIFRARRKGLRVAIHFARDLPETVFGDPARLGQVLVNLLGNAIKFTASGTIEISVAFAPEHDPDSDVYMLHFSVCDHGIGIAADKLGSIFEPFRQADGGISREYGGTGLGLTISQRLLQCMDGRIWVESMLGKGSTFHFVVPLGRDSRQPVAAGTRDDVLPIHPGALKLLLAEDNPVNQVYAVTMLKRAGHDVSVANNGEEAVKMATSGNFDAILMDVHMPVVDGFAATRQLRERGLTLPIIAVTAHAMSGFREECLKCGMNDYLPKPFHSEDLLAKLERLRVGTAVRPAAVHSSVAPTMPPNGQRLTPAAEGSSVLDIAGALEMTGGNRDALRTMMGMVLAQIGEDRPKLHDLAVAGASIDLRDAAHRLKGSLAAIGARDAQAACLALETLARGNQTEACPEAMQTLDTQLDIVMDAIGVFLRSQ